MLSYVARRVLYAIVTFVGITIAVFALIHVVPGDPIDYYIGSLGPRSVPPEIIESLRREHHLDRRLSVQYLYWFRAAARFDFGRSLVDRRPVVERIAEKLPNTFTLNLIAFLVAIAIAVPLGLLNAANPRGWLDRGSGVVLLLLYSLPSFWVALLLMDLFSVRLQVLPLYGMGSAKHFVLPVITLAYAQLAVFSRFSRAAMLDVVHRDFITTARAKGVGEGRVIVHHAFRNALIPLITLLGFVIPFLISGSVIVERMFQWDGIGNLYFDAILAHDYPTVMGLTVITAIVTLCATLIADLLYAVADPRIRLGESEVAA